MKIQLRTDSWRVVAAFGGAKLVVDGSGKMELRGGSRMDEISAREWISLFWHEAVPCVRKN